MAWKRPKSGADPHQTVRIPSHQPEQSSSRKQRTALTSCLWTFVHGHAHD
ncbi:rCG24656 [Rattus norvegicus]|uniref:RCG24656 n=1 Tax=Rattus norvegicus TaxID=10116 RepID=A6JBX5_RAT|nr:rCG24656 [Rattus norvegicus]